MGVIGAGIGGLTAARELYRYGFNNVHIFEATSRVGGRLCSEPATRFTAYELGAMRMPFFRAATKERPLARVHLVRTQSSPSTPTSLTSTVPLFPTLGHARAASTSRIQSTATVSTSICGYCFLSAFVL